MELKDYIEAAAIVASTTIALGGWIFTRWQDRTHELFRERLKRRMALFDELFLAMAALHRYLAAGGGANDASHDVVRRLQDSDLKIRCYGTADEIEAIEALMDAMRSASSDTTGKIMSDACRTRLAATYKAMVDTALRNLRRELGYRNKRHSNKLWLTG